MPTISSPLDPKRRLICMEVCDIRKSALKAMNEAMFNDIKSLIRDTITCHPELEINYDKEIKHLSGNVEGLVDIIAKEFPVVKEFTRSWIVTEYALAYLRRQVRWKNFEYDIEGVPVNGSSDDLSDPHLASKRIVPRTVYFIGKCRYPEATVIPTIVNGRIRGDFVPILEALNKRLDQAVHGGSAIPAP